MIDTLVMIMAGGKGERLFPLNSHRAKPAVPFGGNYRIIDFVLSNFINSGFFRIKVLTQYRSSSLLIHLRRGFNFGSMTEHYVDPIPAQQGASESGWYLGTADAIYQNLQILCDENPRDVAVFGGDHIYKMDVSQMVDFHRRKRAACTVATVPFDRASAAHQFGIIEVDENWRIIGFDEKPADPKPIPGMPDKALVSMGNYVFTPDTLAGALANDHLNPDSSHDFGKDVIPSMIQSYPAYAYNFLENEVPGEEGRERGYWRDIGTIDSYFDASMDLRGVNPQLNLYNYRWPIRSVSYNHPAAKFVFDEDGRRGTALDSIVSGGAILSGGTVRGSVIFDNVYIHSGALVEESVLMQRCNIGRGVKLCRVICDKDVTIEDGTVIGEDPAADAQRFHVSPGGVVVIPKGTTVPRHGPAREISPENRTADPRPHVHHPGSVIISE